MEILASLICLLVLLLPRCRHPDSFRGGAPRLDCKKGSPQGDEMSPSLAGSSNSDHVFQACQVCFKVPPFFPAPIPTERQRRDLSSSLTLRALPCAPPPCFIHTPRRQWKPEPDWRQTDRARGSGRHRSSCCSWRSGAERGGAERKTRSGAPPRRGPDPDADADDGDARFCSPSPLASCLPRYHASVNARRCLC